MLLSDLKQYRPVYAPKDFLEVLLNIQNPNHEKLMYVNMTEYTLYSDRISHAGQYYFET